jgi:hypothetical protein
MILILALVPWVLTVGALIFIMVHNRHDEYEDDDDFMFDDEDHEIVRVAVYDEKAYWVHENVFYESDVTREPDFTTARAIDTMSMSPKQLNKLLNILDELENNNERE